jgi:hypothetical protein
LIGKKVLWPFIVAEADFTSSVTDFINSYLLYFYVGLTLKN